MNVTHETHFEVSTIIYEEKPLIYQADGNILDLTKYYLKTARPTKSPKIKTLNFSINMFIGGKQDTFYWGFL